MSAARKNFATLIKEELVKRYEDVVKEEVRKHNIAVENSNRDIKNLKNLLEEQKKTLEEIQNNNTRDYVKVIRFVKDTVSELEKSFDDQRRYIKTHSQQMICLSEELEKRMNNLSPKEDLEELIKLTRKEFLLQDSKRNSESESVKQLMHSLLKELEYQFQKETDDIGIKLFDLDKNIQENAKKLQINETNTAGVLRELQIYKKSVFIIEKKIEDLYTKISEINTKLVGSALSHKPV